MKTSRVYVDHRYVATTANTRDVLEFSSRLEEQGYSSLTLQTLRKAAENIQINLDLETLASLFNTQAQQFQRTFRTFGESEPVGADILLTGDPCVFHVFFYRFSAFGPAKYTFCDLNVLFSSAERPAAVDNFFSLAATILRDLKIVAHDTQLKARESTPPDIPQLAGLRQARSPDSTSLDAAKAMAEPATRAALLAIKRGALSTVDELTKGRAKPAKLTSNQFSRLVQLGLLTVEYAVLCKGISNRVYASPSREEIRQSQNRCLQCGQQIASHDAIEIASTTPLCDQLLLKSRWMLVMAMDTLLTHGIPLEHISVPPEDSGSDEIDLAFLHEGELILAELKDSDFGQGDASNFAVRLKQVEKVSKGVVVVTGSVDASARQTFDTLLPKKGAYSLFEKSISIHILEGPSSFQSDLSAFLTEEQVSKTVASLDLCGPCAGLEVSNLVRRKLGIAC